MPSYKTNRTLITLGITALTFSYLGGIGALPLFDWDEINFAEIAREMHASGNFHSPTVGYRLFHEKPPFFIWLQATAMEIFGVKSFAARLPNVVCGLLTLLLLLRLGSRRYSPRFAVWWAALMGISLLPALYFRSGIIDPWFNLFTFASVWCLARPRAPSWRAVLLSGGCLGMAVLTKGPAAGLIVGLVCAGLLVLRPANRTPRAGRYLLVGLLGLVPIAAWLIYLWPTDGGSFARDFLTYQWRLFSREDAGHGGFPGFHAIVLLLGCFPAGILALPALFGRKSFATPTDQLCRLLFWVTLGIFTVVSTKIVHYSSLCYLPLSYFAARYVAVSTRRGAGAGAVEVVKGKAWVRNSLLVVLGLYTLASLLLPLAGQFLPRVKSLVATDAELLSRLSLPVSWPLYTFLPGVLLAAGWAYLYRIRKAATLRRFTGALLITVFCFTQAALYVFAPRIQAYSQGAAVAFFSDLAGQEVTVGTAYYKSYAHWFYARIPPGRSPADCADRQCRFHGPNPLPLYFASPLRKRDQVLREVPDADHLYDRGGFSFFHRPAASPQ